MRKFLVLLTLPLLLAACGGRPASGFRPIDPEAAVFWDRQTTESAELLRGLADEFNRGRPGLPIKVERAGGYTEIFRKVSASIQAGALPSMAVSYESMTSEYVPTGAVLPLDDYLGEPGFGLSAEDRADFFPVALDTNIFPEFGGRMYSFPFAKSVLMLYFSRRLLTEAGLDGPPGTWDQFIEQCRQIKARTGKFAYAVNVDCSMINALIFSLGGEVVRGRETLYDSPAGIRAFEIFETLVKEQLAYQITPGSYDDEVALSKAEVAFAIRSSSGRGPMAVLMKDQMDDWGMAAIPQGDPARPATVLFGPNITIFNTTPEHQRAAWAFVKYFTSTEVSVRWALGTGYLPIRKSAAKDARLQAFWAEWPYNRAAYDCLEFARPEPNLSGWQQVRDLVERAETEVLTGIKTGRQAALDLKKQADAALQRR
jgi:multiple sugar transport system substrate-binding protein